MKKPLLILFIFSFSLVSEGAIHQIQVWNGDYQFLPPNNITVQVGDTIQWIPLDPPTMTHTITSDSIPAGAVAFNQIWQLPADTFFQYIPQVVGLYKYVCTPHIHLNMIGEFTVVNGTNSQLCDSVIISFNQIDTTVNPDLIYFDVQVFGYGPNVGYPGFVLLNNIGDTIAYENINTAGNVFTLMPNAVETRVLDVVQNFSLPFSGSLHLVDSWFAGNPSTACIYPFNINIGTTGVNVIDKNKNIVKIIELLGREGNRMKNQFIFYIYDDGTVEKRITIE